MDPSQFRTPSRANAQGGAAASQSNSPGSSPHPSQTRRKKSKSHRLDSKVYHRTGKVIPDWFQASPKNVKLHQDKTVVAYLEKKKLQTPKQKKDIKKKIGEIQRFSESMFYNLKAQRVDAKLASGDKRAGFSGKVRRLAPREMKRRKKNLKAALAKISRVSHLEDLESDAKLEWNEDVFGCEECRLFLYDADNHVASGYHPHKSKRVKYEAGKDFVGTICLKGTLINVVNAQKDSRFNKEADSLTESFLGQRVENTFGQPLVP